MSKKSKKIIILYSTAGLGHKKAAMALVKAFRDRREDIDVEIIDLLECANRLYKFLYLNVYVFLMRHAKWVWKILYYFTNMTVVDILTRRMRGIMDSRNLPGLAPMLVEKAPDAIVATHFLLPSIAGILKKHEGFRSGMFTVITDYGPHSYWLSDYIDRFFVGSPWVSLELIKRGIPAEKINATGIPTTAEFCGQFNAEQLRGKYGLDREKKTVFLMSGGFGVGPVGKVLLSLNSCHADIQVIVVCGHNRTAYENIRLLKEKLRYPLVLIGFTDKVAEIMSVSDLMITKAGGISVTEAMNMRLPMILFASIPGQETWNEKFLMENDAAEKARRITDIPVIADRILISQDVYETFKTALEKVRRPHAAEAIVDIVLRKIGLMDGESDR